MVRSRNQIRVSLLAVALLVTTSLACVCGIGGRQRLTPHSPVWSPDGDQIAFVGCRPKCSLYLVDVQDTPQGIDGSDPVRLSTRSVYKESPAWSPDSAKIVFTSSAFAPPPAPGYPKVYVVDVQGALEGTGGAGPVEIGYGIQAAWSPDGSRLAYVNTCTECVYRGLNVVDPDDDNLATLTERRCRLLGWSSDGQQVFYRVGAYSDDEGKPFVVTVPDASQGTGGSDETLIADARLPDAPFALSPDGKQLLYAAEGNVYRINIDGSDRTRLSSDAAESTRPLWSPDGAQIVFVSDRHDNDEIYVMDADGGNHTRLTDHPASDVDPAWSPDGQRIVFVSYRDSRRGDLYVINADGSGLARLTN